MKLFLHKYLVLLIIFTISCKESKIIRIPIEVPVKVEVTPKGNEWFCFSVNVPDETKAGMLCFAKLGRCENTLNKISKATTGDTKVELGAFCKKGTFIETKL